MNRTNNPALSPIGSACGAVFAVVLFAANGDGSQPFSGPRAVAGVAALTLAIPFFGYLATVLRPAREDGAGGWLARTALCAGIAWAALKLGSGAPDLAVARAHVAAGTSLHTALSAIADGATVISLLPLAVCCAAIAVLAFRTRALPRWLAAGAGITALALAVNGAFIETSSVPAMLLFILWTLLASGYLTLQAWRARAAAHPVPTAAESVTETATRA
ncbi:MAG TPA: hypothetical protein VHV09_07895 [Trebonia sp.]|jgi:hypothetical protein|nr:hypothetical protein [Trebonia sp.]